MIEYVDFVAARADYYKENTEPLKVTFNADEGELIGDEALVESFTLRVNEKRKSRTDRVKKLEGFDYNGVMCSATQRDQSGLTAIFVAIQSGLADDIDFVFENNSKLTITADNLGDFSPEWTAFRQSFFK